MNSVKLPSLFRMAKSVSELSEYKIKVGAVLCDKRHPFSVGYNKIKSHPKYCVSFKNTIHAEAAAIIASGRDHLEGSTIFVYRSTKNGNPALARPCEDCMKILKNFGVKTVFYSTGVYPYFNVEKI